MFEVTTGHRHPRILFFDAEARPGAFIGSDFTGKSSTAWAWAFDDDEVEVTVLERRDRSLHRIIKPFVRAFEKADIVVGHYLRGYDIPLLSADMERTDLGVPPAKLSVDTKLDRVTTLGISESLENLASRYELEHEKMPMTEPMWEEHYHWQTERSVEWIRERVVRDVVVLRELFNALNDNDRLRPPKWYDVREQKRIPRYRG